MYEVSIKSAMRLSYFTPSEAADVAVIYAIIVGFFVYRDLKPGQLFEIMKKSAKTSAVIMIIIACSGPFGWVLAKWSIPEAISTAVLSLLTPVFLPLVQAMGISLVHFGVVFVVGLAIGMITPPVAINLFVASSITRLPITKISKAIIPYLIGLIAVFFAVMYIPLFIPSLIIA